MRSVEQRRPLFFLVRVPPQAGVVSRVGSKPIESSEGRSCTSRWRFGPVGGKGTEQKRWWPPLHGADRDFWSVRAGGGGGADPQVERRAGLRRGGAPFPTVPAARQASRPKSHLPRAASLGALDGALERPQESASVVLSKPEASSSPSQGPAPFLDLFPVLWGRHLPPDGGANDEPLPHRAPAATSA